MPVLPSVHNGDGITCCCSPQCLTQPEKKTIRLEPVLPYSQGLSQDLESGCPKLAKFL